MFLQKENPSPKKRGTRCPKGVKGTCKNTPEKKARAVLKEMQRCIDEGKPLSRKSMAYIQKVPRILGATIEPE